jgi:hypothetical protein
MERIVALLILMILIKARFVIALSIIIPISRRL